LTLPVYRTPFNSPPGRGYPDIQSDGPEGKLTALWEFTSCVFTSTSTLRTTARPLIPHPDDSILVIRSDGIEGG